MRRTLWRAHSQHQGSLHIDPTVLFGKRQIFGAAISFASCLGNRYLQVFYGFACFSVTGHLHDEYAGDFGLLFNLVFIHSLTVYSFGTRSF